MAALKRRSFKPLDQKRVKEGASRTGSRFDSIFKQDVTTLKLKVGVNNLRVVRGPDESYWNETIHVHPWVGSKKSTYLCPRMMQKAKRCPICDAANEAAEAGDKEEAATLSVKERSIAYVINRDDEKQGLQVWDMSWSQARDIDATSDTKRGVLDISHPDEGFDIQIRREGMGLNTRYVGLQVDRDASPLSEDARQQDAWLEEATKKPLSSLLRYYPEDYLADILAGKIEEKDEEDDEADAKPARSRSRRDEKEEVDEEEEQPRSNRRRRDEEEEEERPARSARSRNGKDDDAPWRGDEDEAPKRSSRRGRDEEEEEERPARARRSRDEEEEDESAAEAAEARRWKRGQRDDAEEEERPASRKRRDEDEEEEERPRAAARGRARPDDEPDDPEGEAPRTSRRRARDDEEEEERPRSRSRERIRDDEEEEERPRRSARRDDDDEEEERSTRRRTR